MRHDGCRSDLRDVMVNRTGRQRPPRQPCSATAEITAGAPRWRNAVGIQHAGRAAGSARQAYGSAYDRHDPSRRARSGDPLTCAAEPLLRCPRPPGGRRVPPAAPITHSAVRE